MANTKVKKAPQRTCIGCGEIKDKKMLVRVVRGENIELDVTGKKNGRGAYICKNMECLERAIKTKGLDRSFKEGISKEVYDKLREDMRQIHEG